MKILYINNDGGGFADHIEVAEGTTVQKLFADRVPHAEPSDYLIRVNRQPGFRELCLTDNKSALACFGVERQYVWMPLDPEGGFPHTDDAIRIESPVAEPDKSVSHPQPHRRKTSVSEPVTNTNGHAQPGSQKTNGQPRTGSARKQGQDIDSLIRQAEALRTAQRENLVKISELVKALKRHRRQSRVLQSTIASLRQLKTLGV